MIIQCQDRNLKKGISLLNGYLAVKPTDKFSRITAKSGKENYAEGKDGALDITYVTLNDCYLLLGKALAERTQNFKITVKKRIKDTGVMLDCARNAVIKPLEAKKMIAVCAVLGYNFFELYVEDCIEVDGEPYFGYMRGRFTQAEIKDLDEYAKIFGVELTLCIQTLAHLERLFFHWREYTKVLDKRDVLLVDEPRTYELIENVIKTCRKCLSTDRINIGMDEAFDLGLGQFLVKHGYQPRGAIIRRHLKKVIEICKKYSFRPAMWADMFYDDMKAGNYDGIPKDVELIYWDYGIKTGGTIKARFDRMKPSGAVCSFAGCAMKFLGFAPHNRLSKLAVDSELNELVESGINTYRLTVWADDGGEAAQFSVLPTFCYFSCKNISENAEGVQEICKVISGYTYDELCMLDAVNHLNKDDSDVELFNPCKHLFYADPFIGVEEVAALPSYPKAYERISKKLRPLCGRESGYSYLFDTMYALSRFLELKSYMVEELYYAYKKKDKNALTVSLKRLKTGIARLNVFIKTFEKQWRRENKELGFEVQQIRMYGLKGRLEYIARRLDGYLKGETDNIEELEETKYFYPLTEGDYRGKLYHLYVANVTYGKI